MGDNPLRVEKHGVLQSLPLTCGTCGVVFSWLCLRWCASCGEAICPTCYPAVQDEPLGQCRRCIKDGRPTAIYLAGVAAGRARDREFERRFWGAWLAGPANECDEPLIAERKPLDS